MGLFLAGRGHIRTRSLHERIKNRFQSAPDFGTVQLRVTGPREHGAYRVAATTNPRGFLDDDSSPVASARIEVGFELDGQAGNDSYWFNWIEPERNLLVGWHQDGNHPDLWPVHLQVNQDQTTVARERATFIDNHPMAVVEARLDQLPDALEGVQWNGDTATGLDW